VTKTIAGVEYKRSMFPLIPAFAMTVHRVQGGTLTGPVHILMNQEIFAEGQGYVALRRVKKLSQLHLWCLHRQAIKGSPIIDAEYVRLQHRWLTAEAVAAAPSRERVRFLLPLA